MSLEGWIWYMFRDSWISALKKRNSPSRYSAGRFHPYGSSLKRPAMWLSSTRRGKRECALVSIETYACMSGDYDAEMARVEEANQEYQAKRRADRRAKKNGAADM